MQKYMYEKAMAQETRNGGTSTLNNNNGVDNSKKKLLIALDVFCLLLGKFPNEFYFYYLFGTVSKCFYLISADLVDVLNDNTDRLLYALHLQ